MISRLLAPIDSNTLAIISEPYINDISQFLFIIFIIAINIIPFLVLILYAYRLTVLWKKGVILIATTALFLNTIYIFYHSMYIEGPNAQQSFVFLLVPIMLTYRAMIVIIISEKASTFIYKLIKKAQKR